MDDKQVVVVNIRRSGSCCPRYLQAYRNQTVVLEELEGQLDVLVALHEGQCWHNGDVSVSEN